MHWTRRKENNGQDFKGHYCELESPSLIYPPLPPNAEPGQRLKRCIMPYIVAWKHHARFILLRRSTYAREFDQARQARSSSWWVIHPHSIFRLGWQGFMIFLLTISLFVNTFTISIVRVMSAAGIRCPFEDFSSGMSTIVKITDGIFAINIILKFNTGYCEAQNSVVVMSRRMIARRYFKTWFISDFMSCAPTFVFFYYIIENKTVDYYNFSTMAYKIFRICIQLFYIAILLRIFELLNHLNDWAAQLGIPEYCFRLIKVAILFVCFLHFMACAHFSCSVLINGNMTLDRRSKTWLSKMNATNSLCDIPFSNYLLGMFRAQSFVHGFGFMFPVTKEDKILCLINAWVGKALLAYMLALALNVMQVADEPAVQFERTMTNLKLYMCAKKLPLPMQQRMQHYYCYRMQRRYFDERSILAGLPTALCNDIKIHCCRRLVGQCLLFKNLPKSLIMAIVRELRDSIFLANDVVYVVGASGKSMYFVSSGTLMVMLPSGEEIGHYVEGCYFGEVEMVRARKKRTTSIVALETCELYRLDHTAYKKIVNPVPRLHARLRAEAMKHEDELLTLMEKESHKSVLHSPNEPSIFTVESDISQALGRAYKMNAS